MLNTLALSVRPHLFSSVAEALAYNLIPREQIICTMLLSQPTSMEQIKAILLSPEQQIPAHLELARSIIVALPNTEDDDKLLHSLSSVSYPVLGRCIELLELLEHIQQ